MALLPPPLPSSRMPYLQQAGLSKGFPYSPGYPHMRYVNLGYTQMSSPLAVPNSGMPSASPVNTMASYNPQVNLSNLANNPVMLQTGLPEPSQLLGEQTAPSDAKNKKYKYNWYKLFAVYAAAAAGIYGAYRYLRRDANEVVKNTANQIDPNLTQAYNLSKQSPFTPDLSDEEEMQAILYEEDLVAPTKESQRQSEQFLREDQLKTGSPSPKVQTVSVDVEKTLAAKAENASNETIDFFDEGLLLETSKSKQLSQNPEKQFYNNPIHNNSEIMVEKLTGKLNLNPISELVHNESKSWLNKLPKLLQSKLVLAVMLPIVILALLSKAFIGKLFVSKTLKKVVNTTSEILEKNNKLAAVAPTQKKMPSPPETLAVSKAQSSSELVISKADTLPEQKILQTIKKPEPSAEKEETHLPVDVSKSTPTLSSNKKDTGEQLNCLQDGKSQIKPSASAIDLSDLQFVET
ncbi:MAG: hypothetical protein AAGI66_05625 [Cyanobacteria bacterium P01_H01_bin.74]